MAALGQFRGDTNANWTSTNPILADREFILVKMSENSPWSHFKFGNGVDTYNKLPLLPLVAVQETKKDIQLSKSTSFLKMQNNYKDNVEVKTVEDWTASQRDISDANNS